MVDFNVGVIIAAAGSGIRLGGLIPKQYCKILDKPLMLYALEEFLAIKWVMRIVLVVDRPENVRVMLQESGCYNSSKILIVKGEDTRHRSIKAGLLELQKQFPGEIELVVVHDGVRPLVPAGLVKGLVQAAREHGAAGAVRPLVSTVLRTDSLMELQESLDRSQHVASETPQAFKLSVLASAYNKCSDEDLIHGTECLHLVLKYCNVKAKLIQGPEDLWKVTHRKDLHLANAALKQKFNKVCVIAAAKTAMIEHLVESISWVAASVKHVSDSHSAGVENSCGELFNTVIVFHEQEINEDTHLVHFASMLDTETLGLIVHVITNAQVDGMQGMSVYSLQRSGRSMAHHYEKLRKGVVIVHCVSDENRQLVQLLTSLVQLDPLTFTGQTLFV